MDTRIFLHAFVLYLLLLEVTSRYLPGKERDVPFALVSDVDVEGYLKTFGYMDGIPAGINGDDLVDVDIRDKQVSRSILKFQRYFGLPETGKADSNTVRLMRMPRCGVKDNSENIQRKRSFQIPYSVSDAVKWDKMRLTWKLIRPTNKLTIESQRKTIKDAFQVWETASALDIRETDGEAEIQMYFYSRNHGDGFPFDGKSYVLAHAFPPGHGQHSGEVHFDQEEDWSLSWDKGSNLLVIAAHEIGHSLGLGHTNDQTALMYPTYQRQENLLLGDNDIKAIQKLYGPRLNRDGSRAVIPRRTRPPGFSLPTRSPTVTASSKNTCNVAFDAIVEGPQRFYYALWKGKVFKFDEEGLEPDYPKAMSEVFQGAPSTFDMAFSIEQTRVYITKGDQVWRYNKLQLDPEYPLHFNRGNFPETPKFTMSLVDDRTTSRILLFGRREWWYYSFDQEASMAPRGYSTDAMWDGIPRDVKYSVKWRDNNYYLMTSDGYVRFDHYRRRAVEGGEVKGLPPWLTPTCLEISAKYGTSGTGSQLPKINSAQFTMCVIMALLITGWTLQT